MILSFIFSILISFQSAPKEEVWYVWLDTPAEINGKEVRIVGNELFSITCCVKSGKFSRLEKSATKWVKKNHDPSFDNPNALKKIQDQSLALEVLKNAHEEASTNDAIVLVDYTATCQ